MMVLFKQHSKTKYIYLQHFLDVQILIPQILILQHSNHINSHVWQICLFVLTRAVCSGYLSTIAHTNSGRPTSGTEMSAYGDLTTFSSGADKLRPLSSPTDATERREATAPYVCLMTLQPSRKLLQLFIVLACRTYNLAAVRCFKTYCRVYQNILHSLSEYTAQFIRTYWAVYQIILHSALNCTPVVAALSLKLHFDVDIAN
jgi:hypothetical protein